MNDSIDRLFTAVIAARDADSATSRTARLLRAGRAKMAKKLAEEAVEVVIDAMHGENDAVVRESADLIYHLVVLWVAAGLKPADIWKEMSRRERLFGIAEKIPKDALSRGILAKSPPATARPRVVALESRRIRKRS